MSHTEERHQNTKIIQLPIARGDDYLENLKIDTIDFIKIDVEGFELQVLNGLRATTSKHRPIVAFEFHGQHARPDEFSSIKQCLPSYQFTELLFAPDGGGLLEKARWWLRNGERPRLVPIDVPQARTYENIIALPAERYPEKPSTS